jgi:hypothetical protein
MDLFSAVTDGVAIVRLSKGVIKQTKIYARGDRVYVPHAGGFLRVCAAFGSEFGTPHPDIKVLELEGEGVDVSTGEPRFRAPLKVAA